MSDPMRRETEGGVVKRKAGTKAGGARLDEGEVALELVGEEPLAQRERGRLQAPRPRVILHQPERRLAAQQARAHRLLHRR